uniref:Uncharacterized protein n=1 Tax=Setaria viridis TaxID=4556 RepID=A0A4V6D3E9_SETVI|nr:hypothetical protein SEVIR_8G235500v2 [Setaria viridis]
MGGLTGQPKPNPSWPVRSPSTAGHSCAAAWPPQPAKHRCHRLRCTQRHTPVAHCRGHLSAGPRRRQHTDLATPPVACPPPQTSPPCPRAANLRPPQGLLRPRGYWCRPLPGTAEDSRSATEGDGSGQGACGSGRGVPEQGCRSRGRSSRHPQGARVS